MGHNTKNYLHTLIEATRLSFADAAQFIADPAVVPVPTEGMLSTEYADARRALINPDRYIIEDGRIHVYYSNIGFQWVNWSIVTV